MTPRWWGLAVVMVIVALWVLGAAIQDAWNVVGPIDWFPQGGR